MSTGGFGLQTRVNHRQYTRKGGNTGPFMQSIGGATHIAQTDDAADFTAELLQNLAVIAKGAGLARSASAIGVAMEVVRLESGTAERAVHQTERT